MAKYVLTEAGIGIEIEPKPITTTGNKYSPRAETLIVDPRDAGCIAETVELLKTRLMANGESVLEVAKRLVRDAERLDWLESMGPERRWIARPSRTGRGFRLYPGSSRQGTSDSVREAMDKARED